MEIIEIKHSALVDAISYLQSDYSLDDRQAVYVLVTIIEEMQTKNMYMEIDFMLRALYYNGNYSSVVGVLRCTYFRREYYQNWDMLNSRIERAE
jgi:hypothetical protein